jgi:hypothetical protein
MIDGVVPPYLAYNGKYLVQVLSDGLCGFKHYYFESKEEAHKRFEEIVLENRFYSVTYGIYHNQRDVTIKPDHLVNLYMEVSKETMNKEQNTQPAVIPMKNHSQINTQEDL